VAFSCGVPALDEYLQKRARQDARKRLAAPFVLANQESRRVAGYYTLCAIGIELGDLPDGIASKLPRYPIIPATLLGRLAVDCAYRGQKLGEHLLLDALHRSWRMSKRIVSFAVVVDAKDEQAEAFYCHYELESFAMFHSRLFLPMRRIEPLFQD
jgi:predicted GNAT family N-acyltransferase